MPFNFTIFGNVKVRVPSDRSEESVFSVPLDMIAPNAMMTDLCDTFCSSV